MLSEDCRGMNIRNALARLIHPSNRDGRMDDFAQLNQPIYEHSPLSDLFYGHHGKLIHKWGHFLPIYERHLARYVGTPVRLLELGVSHGGSLELWRDYFGKGAVIYGIDIDPRCKALDPYVRIGSQADPELLNSVVHEMNGVDVVIDDGSHIARHQRASFQTLFPLLATNGVYIAEDLHTAYWPAWEGGLRRRGTFIELMKLLVDDLHAWYHNGNSRVYDAHLSIDGIHFYDSMVVIEKRPKEKPFHIQVGKRSF